MLYAVGEIALVVLGILIALQINNWNENRKTNKQIKIYLSNLIESIESDSINMYWVGVQSETRFRSLDHLLKITGNSRYEFDISTNDRFTSLSGQFKSSVSDDSLFVGNFPDTFSNDFLIQCLQESVFVNTADINSDVYEEMKSIGIFSNIKNDQLKKEINAYYNFFDRTFVLSDWNMELTNTFRTFLRDRFNIVTNGIHFIGEPEVIMNAPVAVSRIQEMTGPARWRASNAFKMIIHGQEIKSLIQQYIEDND